MAQDQGKSGGIAAAVAPDFILDRREAVPALLGRHEDFLIVTGLAGTAKDIAALTKDGEHTFTMAGAMGAACAMGLGLALARPDKRVLVITGEAEIADGARLLRAGNGTAFVLLRVKPTDPPGCKRDMDAASVRIRFKT